MTKDRSMTHDTPRDRNAYKRLRAELLVSGLSDWVSLAEVQQIISHFQLADTDRARQDLVLRTIRSLLDDGLMQIGELPGPDERFPAWEPVDVALVDPAVVELQRSSIHVGLERVVGVRKVGERVPAHQPLLLSKECDNSVVFYCMFRSQV